MTWQRIDENTYIDDTLVTCAEYQLFIDEMREQGKYYQPDHWTSYQFPQGQAREPILGVRHSDAVAFCEWLTTRKDGGWNFCLPNHAEVNVLFLKPFIEKTFGYWTLASDPNSQFAWIGLTPKNICSSAIVTALKVMADRIVQGEINLGEELYFSWERKDRTEFQNRFIAKAIERAITYDHPSALNVDYFLNLFLNIVDRIHRFGSYKQIARDQIDNIAKNVLTAFARNLESSTNAILDISLVTPIIFTALDRGISEDGTSTLDRLLMFNSCIVTLRERIAGRSPAFEGIRLVRERIK